MASVAEVQAMMAQLQAESAKQMQEFMTTILKQITENEQKTQQQEVGEGSKPKDKDRTIKETFDEKFIKRLKNNFDGKQENWKTWIFKFKNQVKLKSKQVHEVLNTIEKKEHPITDEEMDEYNGDDWVMELYDVLCEVLEGTALVQIQNVKDNNGLEAYRKIFRFYNPTTPAKLLKKLVDIVKPPKIEKIEEAVSMLEQWKLKVNELNRDFGEKEPPLSEKMQIAIATSMMPHDVQEIIFNMPMQ